MASNQEKKQVSHQTKVYAVSLDEKIKRLNIRISSGKLSRTTIKNLMFHKKRLEAKLENERRTGAKTKEKIE